jgi:DNA repair protein RadC
MPISSKLASLRLEILREERRLGDVTDIVGLFRRWGFDKEPQECAWVVAYDSQLSIRTVVEVGRWSHISVNIHLPTLLSAVLLAGCERFTLVHNHPSASAQPSLGDRQVTVEIMEAANACGLYFEDHLIVTPRKAWFSFERAGLLKAQDYGKHAAAHG